jgi:quercetin dioxygenase-like cupin family protein
MRTMSPGYRLRGVILLLSLLLASLTGFSAPSVLAHDEGTPAASPAASSAPAVVREVINEGMPTAAPGKVLQLVQYTIPGNIALPAHTHPGMQVNVVVSGTLTYTVVEGEAQITRVNGTPEILSSGQTTDLLPGDTITEPEGMIHFGENLSEEPIILLTASLFDADQPPSAVVSASSDATPGATPAS